MTITAVIWRSASEGYKISSEMLESVTWTGDINSFHRTATIDFKNTKDMKKRLVKYSPGDLVILYKDGKRFFKGYIFKYSLSDDGSESIVCYDNLIYLAKNADTVLFKNQTAAGAIRSLCKKHGVPVGSIASTGYKFKRKLYEEKSLNDIFSDLLEETKKKTGKSYIFRAGTDGKVNLYNRDSASKLTVTINDVLGASKDVSIEDLRNKILVTKGSLDSKEKKSKYITRTAQNSSSISKYGRMQHVESVDDDYSTAKMEATAKSLLKELNRSETEMSIDFIGNIACITGNKIAIDNNLTNIDGTYFITSDSHSFSNGVHKMSLQISTKLE